MTALAVPITLVIEAISQTVESGLGTGEVDFQVK
jgi:hypothetical protein